MSDLGELFKARRQALNLPLSTAATLAGVKEDTLRYIERGERFPYRQTADVIADALGCRIVVSLIPKDSEVKS